MNSIWIGSKFTEEVNKQLKNSTYPIKLVKVNIKNQSQYSLSNSNKGEPNLEYLSDTFVGI